MCSHSVDFFLIFSMATKWDKYVIFPKKKKYFLGILVVKDGNRECVK